MIQNFNIFDQLCEIDFMYVLKFIYTVDFENTLNKREIFEKIRIMAGMTDKEMNKTIRFSRALHNIIIGNDKESCFLKALMLFKHFEINPGYFLSLWRLIIHFDSFQLTDSELKHLNSLRLNGRMVKQSMDYGFLGWIDCVSHISDMTNSSPTPKQIKEVDYYVPRIGGSETKKMLDIKALINWLEQKEIFEIKYLINSAIIENGTYASELKCWRLNNDFYNIMYFWDKNKHTPIIDFTISFFKPNFVNCGCYPFKL